MSVTPAMDTVGDMVIPGQVLPLIKWGKMERLTCRQAAILLLVRENPGANPSALAHIMDLPKPAVTRAVDKLIHWGLMTRSVSATDRRMVELWPTAKKVAKS